jgi:hypothetical protein
VAVHPGRDAAYPGSEIGSAADVENAIEFYFLP